MSGESTSADVLRILLVVYFGNMLGAVLIAVMVFSCGQFDYSAGMLGGFAIKNSGW